jgi:tetratricopeptide (TPR) repeat protein
LIGFGVLAAVIAFDSVALAADRNDAAVPSPRPARAEIARWLDRTERHAAGLNETELAEVLPTICDVMVEANRAEQLDRLLATIKDPEGRAKAAAYVCMSLAAAGKYEVATRRAQELPSKPGTRSSGQWSCSWRDGVLLFIARVQSSAYEFAGAKQTISLIGDAATVCGAYERLAEYQAKAGRYAEADKSLEKAVPSDEYHKNRKEETRQLIATYKAKRWTFPPTSRSGNLNLLEGLRQVSTIFADSGMQIGNLAGAETAEQEAEKLKGPANKTAAWREIAWAYYELRGADPKNLERCRRAIDKSVDYAAKIPAGLGASYFRSVAFASAANLYLELGETEIARKLVKKADVVSLAGDMLGGLNSFTTTPLLIAVLVRVGDVEGGAAIAEKLQRAAAKEKDAMLGSADFAWFTWAFVCGLTGKTDRVERQLEKAANARTKAVLCAGVAEGLVERQKRPAGKKP